MGTLSKDLLSSAVVFLIALPLAMGISIASGVPPALGLVTAIIGGIVVGALAGAPLQVSGPAAGLTVLVFDLVRDHGIGFLGPVLILAGLLQICAGRLRMGQWFRAMSPSVVFGMLAGIGVLIVASQFHVMLDDKPRASGLENLISIPAAVFGGIFPLDGSKHEIAALLGIFTIVALMAFDKLKRGPLKLIPGALAGVMLASGIASVFQLPVQFVVVPSNLLEVIKLPSLDPSTFLGWNLVLSAAALAFIASAETLLSATAVDRMQNIVRTDYDKELVAQGVGNMLCGVVGALPLTGVIVRSSANVQAGARTRLSTMLHGVWLLAFVALLPSVLRMIPTSSLGAILVFTGWKLMDIKNIKQIMPYGRMPVIIYAATVIMIVATDLLTGVITGIGLTLLKLVYKMSHLEVNVTETNRKIRIDLVGAATFVGLPKLAKVLDAVPAGTQVYLNVERLAYIDHACLDLISGWRTRHETTGGELCVEWNELVARFGTMATSPALAEQPVVQEKS
ncbi:MAG: SulP family inorganic anion transporter [Bryobacteraceae bacterium]|nr:SulP family inorganic anion transporter [Bryobacteraceae bacterium]